MGMAYGLESGSCSAEDLKMARSLVPKALEPYVTGQLAPVTGRVAGVRTVPQAPGRLPSLLRMAQGCSTKSKDRQGCEGPWGQVGAWSAGQPSGGAPACWDT